MLSKLATGYSWAIASNAVLPAIFLAWVAVVIFASNVSKSKDLGRTGNLSDFLANPISTFRKRLTAWSFLFRGPLIIEEAYHQANGKPFAIDGPDNRYILVSSWDQIKEIDDASDNVLSLQAAAREILQPKHTMVGFEWHDRKGFDGAPLLRTIRYLLTAHLPHILPDIRASITHRFEEQVESHPIVTGRKVSPVYLMVIGAVTQSNAQAFFGQELSKNREFMDAGKLFIEQTLLIAEAVRLLPHVISGHIGDFLANRLNSGKVIFNCLEPVVSKRFEERELLKRGHDIPEKKDCIQWIMDNSPKAKPCPYNFHGKSHLVSQPDFMLGRAAKWHFDKTTTFALFDLCLHPEYLAPLRKEIEDTTWKKFEESGGQLFPLMDSFIKESARLNPVESVSTRRKATQPFSLADGTTVRVGEWICSAVRGMNLDPLNYPKVKEFHGFRFCSPEILESSLGNSFSPNEFQIPDPTKSSQFVDLTDWQLWGTGKSACTGRWYAAAMIKVILGTFIERWDMELAHPNAKRYFCWRTFFYPKPNTKVVLNPRAI